MLTECLLVDSLWRRWQCACSVDSITVYRMVGGCRLGFRKPFTCVWRTQYHTWAPRPSNPYLGTAPLFCSFPEVPFCSLSLSSVLITILALCPLVFPLSASWIITRLYSGKFPTFIRNRLSTVPQCVYVVSPGCWKDEKKKEGSRKHKQIWVELENPTRRSAVFWRNVSAW